MIRLIKRRRASIQQTFEKMLITNHERNANQFNAKSHNEIPSQTYQNDLLKSQKTTDAGEAAEKRECLNSCQWECKLSHCGSNLEISFKT